MLENNHWQRYNFFCEVFDKGALMQLESLEKPNELPSPLDEQVANLFPKPSCEEREKALAKITELGKKEVYALSVADFSQFIYHRYISGPNPHFSWYGANPRSLTKEQADLPATILLHASESNQGEWAFLLHSMSRANFYHRCGPVFTINFKEGSGHKALIEKIRLIQKIYNASGGDAVKINLVGHSLGAILAAEYALDSSKWVENVTVNKVISIAGRLKNIDLPKKTPFYGYCYDTLKRIEPIVAQIDQNESGVTFYAIAGENDWLVPLESVLVGKENVVIPRQGHVLIVTAKQTHEVVMNFLLMRT